ncbi:hypothetical protein [Corynebacterium accolens]|uniref:hypothetical protein n=2 Tax=Corynebacterium TaxID=1716 RepID=UPI001EDC6C56|nr:hypothetical protein [Corynebacterium accolens]
MREIDYQTVRELYDQGRSRNAIAKEMGTTTYQVDKACKELGISWNGNIPTTAVRVRSQRAANERAEVAAKFRALAQRELDKALKSEEPDADIRHHVTSAAIAVQRDLEIATHVAENDEHADRTPQEREQDKSLSVLDSLNTYA